MACSNERSAHPSELFGEDWLAWGNDQFTESASADKLAKASEPTTLEKPAFNSEEPDEAAKS